MDTKQTRTNRHFSNWLSFFAGSEDALIALVLASELKPKKPSRRQLLKDPQMPLVGHVFQILNASGHSFSA